MCSFCGKRGIPEEKLAGGLGAMICKTCAAHCAAVLDSNPTPVSDAMPPWGDADDTALLGNLTLIAANAEQSHLFLVEWVDLLRTRGVSWAAIGAALGVSRQAAWERFSAKVDRLRAVRHA
ncbi:ClpX C4-type zinc finger protein [Nocardioides marmoraquaticus]